MTALHSTGVVDLHLATQKELQELEGLSVLT